MMDIRENILKELVELKKDKKRKYVSPKDFLKITQSTENQIVQAMDKMTKSFTSYYQICCPMCEKELMLEKELPTSETNCACICEHKFELKLKHISLIYRIKKTV